MRWIIKNKIIIGSFILLSVFFSGLLSLPSYAINDISITYNSGSNYSDWQDIFPNCSVDCLNDYSFLKITGATFIPGLRFRFDGSSVLNQGILNNFRGYEFIMSLPFDGHSNNLLQFYSSGSFISDVTFTLLTSINSCPEPEICPVLPDNPYDPKFDEIIRAIYTCGAICLVLYFFYCIYRLIIKNTGGQ